MLNSKYKGLEMLFREVVSIAGKKDVASKKDVRQISESVNVHIGPQYSEFLRTVGHIDMIGLEVYGYRKDKKDEKHIINAYQSEANDIYDYGGIDIDGDYIPVLPVGNGDIYLIDYEDNVFLYSNEDENIMPKDKKFAELVEEFVKLYE